MSETIYTTDKSDEIIIFWFLKFKIRYYEKVIPILARSSVQKQRISWIATKQPSATIALIWYHKYYNTIKPIGILWICHDS